MSKVCILFVCLGNICRSPLAEGVFLHYGKTNHPSMSIEADSCGTYGGHSGESPDSRSRQVALKYGFDISAHKARKLRTEDFQKFDYIICMDDSNYSDVLRSKPKDHVKAEIFRFVEFLPKEECKNVREIPDPYYGDKSDFDYVYQLLNKGMPNLFSKITSKL
jgi:protein-tyrosine phosphatase